MAREWCQQSRDRGEAGLRLAGALGRYWQIRAPVLEGRQWLAQALADGPTEPSAAVGICAAVASWQTGHDLQRGNILWARWSWTPRADDESLAAARAALGERAFAVAWAAGRQLPLTDAFADALTAEGLDPSPEPLVTAPT